MWWSACETVAANKSCIRPTDGTNTRSVHLSHRWCILQTYVSSVSHRRVKAAKNDFPCIISHVIYRVTAQDKILLANLQITHVVNAADGPRHIDTGPCFYKGTNILYHGIEAPDCKDFDLSPFFTETADFIHKALSQKGKSPFENSRNPSGCRCRYIIVQYIKIHKCGASKMATCQANLQNYD